MAKTDKELTTEIVIAFLNSWNAKSNTQPIKTNDAVDIIKTVYNAIHSLPDDSE